MAALQIKKKNNDLNFIKLVYENNSCENFKRYRFGEIGIAVFITDA